MDVVAPMALAEPDWTAKTIAIGTVATAVVLAATALFVGKQLRDARRTRHALLLTDLSRRWDDEAFMECQALAVQYREDALVKLVKRVYEKQTATTKQRDDLRKLQVVPNFWETIGVLQAEGAVSVSVIEKMWGDAVLAEWSAWDSATEELRELQDLPDVYIYFQALADAVKRLRRRQRLARWLTARLRAGKRGPGKTGRTRIQVWVTFFFRRFRL